VTQWVATQKIGRAETKKKPLTINLAIIECFILRKSSNSTAMIVDGKLTDTLLFGKKVYSKIIGRGVGLGN